MKGLIEHMGKRVDLYSRSVAKQMKSIMREAEMNSWFNKSGSFEYSSKQTKWKVYRKTLSIIHI